MLTYTIILGVFLLLLIVRVGQLYQHVILLQQSLLRHGEMIDMLHKQIQLILKINEGIVEDSVKRDAKVSVHSDYLEQQPEFIEYVRNKLVDMEINDMIGGEDETP